MKWVRNMSNIFDKKKKKGKRLSWNAHNSCRKQYPEKSIAGARFDYLFNC